MTFSSLGARPGERRGYVPLESGQLHYREMGEGRPLLLIHQAPWSSVQFAQVMPLLAAEGFKVIVPDLPGHGMSDPLEEPTVAGFAAAVRALVETLGFGRVALLGHHGGALVAAAFGARYAEHVSMLVLDNAPFYSTEQRAQRLTMIRSVGGPEAHGKHLADRWALIRKLADPAWSDETVHLAVLIFFANGKSREDGHRALIDYHLEVDLPNIMCPALIMASCTDPIYPSGKAIAALRPDWRYTELFGGAGMVFERPQEWMAAFVPFLNEVSD